MYKMEQKNFEEEINAVIKEVGDIIYRFLEVEGIVNVKIDYASKKIIVRLDIKSIDYSKFRWVYVSMLSDLQISICDAERLSLLLKEECDGKTFTAYNKLNGYYFLYSNSVYHGEAAYVSKYFKLSKTLTNEYKSLFPKQLYAYILTLLFAKPIKVNLDEQLKIL